MNDPARPGHPFGRTREEDLRILADGGETGWWDDTGRPAPWPGDLLDPESEWTTEPASPHRNDPENPPF